MSTTQTRQRTPGQSPAQQAGTASALAAGTVAGGAAALGGGLAYDRARFGSGETFKRNLTARNLRRGPRDGIRGRAAFNRAAAESFHGAKHGSAPDAQVRNTPADLAASAHRKIMQEATERGEHGPEVETRAKAFSDKVRARASAKGPRPFAGASERWKFGQKAASDSIKTSSRYAMMSARLGPGEHLGTHAMPFAAAAAGLAAAGYVAHRFRQKNAAAAPQPPAPRPLGKAWDESKHKRAPDGRFGFGSYLIRNPAADTRKTLAWESLGTLGAGTAGIAGVAAVGAGMHGVERVRFGGGQTGRRNRTAFDLRRDKEQRETIKRTATRKRGEGEAAYDDAIRSGEGIDAALGRRTGRRGSANNTPQDLASSTHRKIMQEAAERGEAGAHVEARARAFAAKVRARAEAKAKAGPKPYAAPPGANAWDRWKVGQKQATRSMKISTGLRSQLARVPGEHGLIPAAMVAAVGGGFYGGYKGWQYANRKGWNERPAPRAAKAVPPGDLAKAWDTSKHPREHDGQFAGKPVERAGRFLAGAGAAAAGYTIGRDHGGQVGKAIGRKVGEAATVLRRTRMTLDGMKTEARAARAGQSIGNTHGHTIGAVALGVGGALAGGAAGALVDRFMRRRRAIRAGRLDVYQRLNAGTSVLPNSKKQLKAAADGATSAAKKVGKIHQFVADHLG